MITIESLDCAAVKWDLVANLFSEGRDYILLPEIAILGRVYRHFLDRTRKQFGLDDFDVSDDF